MSTLFDVPQFSQGMHIVNLPPEALAKSFPQRIRAMLGELKPPGVFFIEVLPTIIVKQSSSAFFVVVVFMYLFSCGSALDEKAGVMK